MPCKMVKQYLQSEDVEYKEFDVEDCPDALAEFSIMSVPTLIYIENFDPLQNNNPTKTSIGFNMPKLQEIVSDYKG